MTGSEILTEITFPIKFWLFTEIAELEAELSPNTWTNEIVLSEQVLHVDTSASGTLSLSLHLREPFCYLHSRVAPHPPSSLVKLVKTVFIVICLAQERLKIKHCLRAGYTRL